MPQMAPIKWLSLFFMFTITYIIFNIMNYYNFFLLNPNKINKNDQYNNLNKNNFYMNWKW